MLYLVRHAMPAASEQTDPAEWPLTAEGRQAAELLSEALPADGVYAASAELKSQQTLPGLSPRVDPRFDEVSRPGEGWRADFRERRRAWVGGQARAGWESHEVAAARFGSGLAAARQEGRPLVVASHGMVLTNWLVAVGALTRAHAPDFWDELGFPDCWLVSEDRLVGRLPRLG